jgi:Uma2 family endonuclease
MIASVRIQSHSEPHFLITTWLGHYAVATPGVRGADNATARFDPDNEPQPDATLFIDPACGGQASISEDDYLEGAPELAVEVAASSASYDLHDKKRAYRRNGVQEYLVWRTREEALDWFVLDDERYVRLEPGDDGLIESRVFPGLYLEAEALLEGDAAAVLDTVRAGTETEEHAAFVDELDEQSA